MTNIFDYFTGKLGRNPSDSTLVDLEVDSVCGADCVGMIDWTAECIARAPKNNESKWIVDDLIRACDEYCDVYWNG